jgi:hypothetical protein
MAAGDEVASANVRVLRGRPTECLHTSRMTAPSSPTYRAADSVRARSVGGEFVILDLAGDVQYSMNELGARVWAEATGGANADGIVRALVAEYAVDADQVRADVERILEELVASGLLIQAASPGAAGPR